MSTSYSVSQAAHVSSNACGIKQYILSLLPDTKVNFELMIYIQCTIYLKGTTEIQWNL